MNYKFSELREIQRTRRLYRRLLCAILGHQPWADPLLRPFSTRHRVCRRCGRFPVGTDLTKALR